ncbi:cell adhesion molecule 2-like [Aplochiton taeniatus]
MNSLEAPEDIALHSVNHTTPVPEGTEYQLQCEIINVAPIQNLTVTWYKGNYVLRNDSFNKSIKKPVTESLVFTITLGREDNGAQFRCEAELHLGLEGPQRLVKSSQAHKVQVQYSPTFLLTDNVVEVSEGSDVSLNCSADGNPQPKFHWASDSADHVNETTEGQGSNVYITGVTANTTYKCTATNTLGSISKSIHVIVKPLKESSSTTTIGPMTTPAEAEPRMTNPLELSHPKVVVRYGASVSVNCSTSLAKHEGLGWEAKYGVEIQLTPNHSAGLMSEGEEYKIACDIENIAPIRHLIVTWYRGTQIIGIQSFNETTETPVNQSASFNITANRSDNGIEFRCEAKLDLGPEGPQPPLTVTSQPFIAIVHCI